MQSTTRHTACDRRLRAAIASSLFAILAAAAHAQPVPVPSGSPAEGEEVIEMMEFFVTEKGVTRATNTITAQDAQVSLPGASIEKLLDNVPGVNIRTTDPFGHYEFGNDIRIRSFTINQLAVTIDDVPMGNNSPRYGTPSGRIVDSENLLNITVSQGTGDVSTPGYEVLGGAIKFSTINPSLVPVALVKVSYGDFDAKKIFARFETGEILPGLTAFVSASDFSFKSAGIPDDSQARRVEAKIQYETEKLKSTLAYTWNDRDDFDTRSIQWSRWRALETGRYDAGYGAGTARIYNADEIANLEILAGGYDVYYPDTVTFRGTAANGLYGDYSDGARTLGASTYIDPNANLGDGINGQYFNYWHNGRMDSFLRSRTEIDVTEDIKVAGSVYYQDKNYYGHFPVSRGDSISQIRSAYSTSREFREDIWPVYLYRDADDNIVPYGTPGAIPVGYDDTNGNGFFDVGETVNPASTVTEFSAGHALVAPGATTLAAGQAGSPVPGVPGATARDEDFGGDRYGINPTVAWTKGRNRLSAGAWFEKDNYQARRPTYNLQGGSLTGDFLYDQVLFVNYDQTFETAIMQFFVEDRITFFDERLGLSAGFRTLDVDRTVQGQLYPSAFWRGDATREETRQVRYKDNFLPQVGATYKLTGDLELFAGYAENLAAPAPNVATNPTFVAGLKPERSRNWDAGLRYSTPSLGVGLSLFYNQYFDRILTVALTAEELAARGLSGLAGQNDFKNVGGIDSKGAEVSFDWRTPIKGLRVTGAAAYQNAEFTDDLPVASAVFHFDASDFRSQYYEGSVANPNYNPALPITSSNLPYSISLEKQAGMKQGNTPEFTFNADLVYAWRLVSVNFGGQYYDEVYVNTLNTEQIPSYTIFNAGITLKGAKDTRLEPFSVQLSVQNLFDKYFVRASSYTASFNGSVTPDYGRNIVLTVEARF